MPLVYAVISRGVTVLGECSQENGNFPVIARMLLSNLNQNDSFTEKNQSYICEGFEVYTKNLHPFIFLTLSDGKFDPSLAQDFISAISSKFMKSYSHRGSTAIALSMNKELEPWIKEQMASFNNTASNREQTMNKIKRNIEGSKEIMKDSIDKIMARGERIEILVDRSQELENQSTDFRRDTRSTQNRMWWRTKKNYFVVGAVGFGVTTFFAMINCGITLGQCL